MRARPQNVGVSAYKQRLGIIDSSYTKHSLFSGGSAKEEIPVVSSAEDNNLVLEVISNGETASSVGREQKMFDAPNEGNAGDTDLLASAECQI